MKDRNKTLERRAQEFCASGEYSPTLKEAYIGGVKSGYEDLTEWLNPAEELPNEGEEVLCIIHRHFQTYAVLRHLDNQWWQPLAPQPGISLGGWVAVEKEPIAWRPIHELN